MLGNTPVGMRTPLLAFLLIVILPLRGQHVCTNTTHPPADLVARALMADAERDEAVRYIKCRVIIGATTVDGTYLVAASAERVQREIDFANATLERCGTGLQLQVCDAFEVNDAPGLYYTGPDQDAFFANRRPGYINIFYVGSIPFVAGGAVLDMVRVSQQAEVSALLHEVGHLLGLGHTYGDGELVDGSNCTTAVDGLCDTPADPGLYLPGMVDIATCTYIGTATDANGDLYQPMLNNVMAASPCLKDSLTPQQGAVMRYVLDSLQVQFLSTTTPVLIDPIPLQLCANAAPFQLSATPAPGTFSGPLVQGDQLINHPNPGGIYHVTYTPDQVPDSGLFELVDAYHVPNLYYQGHEVPIITDSLRQSFIAGRTGSFSRIDARMFSAVQQSMRMRLYEGTGNTLTLLHDTSALFALADTGWIRFAVPPTVACTAGTVYSYVITAAEPFAAIRPSGGYLAWGTNNLSNINLMFRTWVRTAVPCQQATRFYQLYQAPARPVTNLGAVLCHDDGSEMPFLVDAMDLTASAFAVDGVPATTLVPSALAPGPHTAWHIYTINGCTDTTEVSFTVQGPVDFDLSGVPATLCTTDPPFVPQAAPPLGSFLLDGAPVDVVDPQQLPPGTHTLTHVHTSAQDSVTFADQVCCTGGFALNTFLHDDTLSWQSFVPALDGELESIRIPLELFNVPRQLVVGLHSGVGVDGDLLHADTISASTHNGVLLTGTGLQVSAGSAYTWSIRKVSDGDDVLPPMIGITWGDHYTAGIGSAPGTPDTTGDLRFQQYITRRTTCADSTVLPLSVEVCTGLAEGAATGLQVFPQPATDRLVVQGARPEELRTPLALDANGRQVALPALDGRTLDVSKLASGVYVLRLSGPDGRRLRFMKH